MPQRILLIGGPSTGKTSLLRFLEDLGHPCLEEISREVTSKAQQEGIDQLFLEKPLLFSELLRDARIAQYHEAATFDTDIVFIDRGIPDTVAYMDYVNQKYPDSFKEACKRYTYDSVFFLPVWEAIHTTDNERYETFDQAREIEKYLLDTYARYGYNPVEIPKVSIDQRADFILNKLKT